MKVEKIHKIGQDSREAILQRVASGRYRELDKKIYQAIGQLDNYNINVELLRLKHKEFRQAWRSVIENPQQSRLHSDSPCKKKRKKLTFRLLVNKLDSFIFSLKQKFIRNKANKLKIKIKKLYRDIHCSKTRMRLNKIDSTINNVIIKFNEHYNKTN